MPQEKADELEPLGFLEKSHCAPILIALDKNGMMNRNQVYKELGDPIRVIIKRIELLKQYGLIYEIDMTVKPFMKNINLTRKGKKIASYLAKIQQEMEINYRNPITLFEFEFVPKTDKDSERIFDTIPKPITEEYLLSALKELTICPNCSGTLHATKEGRKTEWKCFYCGFKKDASYEEFLLLWELELLLSI